MNVAVRDQLNATLHAAVGAERPCTHGCTHRIVGAWTALGIANSIGRLDSDDVDVEIMRGRILWSATST